MQIVDCVADADDPSQPMKGAVLFEATLESVRPAAPPCAAGAAEHAAARAMCLAPRRIITTMCLQAALRAGVRHLVFTLPPEADSALDDSEAADSWTAQLGPAEPARFRTRISVELRSISAAHLEQQVSTSGEEGDAVAMRLRHPPLLTKQARAPSPHPPRAGLVAVGQYRACSCASRHGAELSQTAVHTYKTLH